MQKYGDAYAAKRFSVERNGCDVYAVRSRVEERSDKTSGASRERSNVMTVDLASSQLQDGRVGVRDI